MIVRIKLLVNNLNFLLLFISLISIKQLSGFHLSFGHRLLKSNSNVPQLNPASTLIRPIECKNANNQSEAGICMFSIDCMQNKGIPLSICKHNYFVGTCCKLPDHNNFVGIVYDLRDTENNNHLLEARKISSTSTSLAPQENGAQSNAASFNTVPASDLKKQVSQQQTSSTTSAPFPTIPATSVPIPSAPGSPPEADLSNLAKERYIISATSLFPVGQQTAATGTTTSTKQQPIVSFPSSESESFKRSSPLPLRNSDENLSSPIPHPSAAENLDPLVKKNQIVVPSELDSFQIQSAQINGSAINQDSQAKLAEQHYDLIRIDYPQASENVAETVLNSAHSPQHGAPLKQVTESIGNRTDSRQQSTKLPEESLPLDGQLKQQVQNIVFANNHQAASSTTFKPLEQLPANESSPIGGRQQQVPGGASEQEFSLSSSTVAVSPSVSNSERPQQQNSSIRDSGNFTKTAESEPVLFDLVSSNSIQTTTPFTTSLSTALLPNVSSHPYSPTTLPPTSLWTRPPSASSPEQSFLFSKSEQPVTTTTSQPTASKPASTTGGESAHSTGLNQLYSPSGSQAQSNQQQLAQIATLANHLHNLNRPLLALQAATKTVSGSSSSNNLIPGLSGLQSAILSHIPFKLASGLSSGLTSYLQAMKPAGSRPLISSNNAPALQYQQNKNQSAFTAGGVKFPTPAPGSVTPTQVSSSPVTDEAASSSQQQPQLAGPTSGSGWQFSNVSSSGGAISVASPGQMSDVVREAQLVCGKPHASSSLLESSQKKRVARIVGGNQSLFGQWPWMVSLRQWRKGAFLHKCGAALLNENWAITAAHCVENVKAADLLLRLGEFDVSNQDEPYPYVERRVQKVVAHPSFDSKTFEYDLALLKFAEPIKYERNVLPVCVPNGNDSYVDRTATVIGWGRLYEDGPLPDIIQHVDVPIITNNECEKMYKNAGYIEEIPDMFICAGISKGGRDSCEGDSGGPLTMVDNDGRSYLVGIISWGIGCALPSQPGVYTRITAFSGWINKITSST